MTGEYSLVSEQYEERERKRKATGLKRCWRARGH